MQKHFIKEVLKHIKERYKNIIEKKKYKIYDNKKITEQIIKDILKLDKQFYKDEYLWDNDYQLKIFNKNKNSIIAIAYSGNIIGYLNYLAIKKEKYDEILNSSITIDEFDINEIISYQKNENNYITLNSVVIDKNFQDGYVVKLLVKRLKKILKKMNDNKYKIAGINSFAVSNDGMKFLERLGFEKRKKLEDNNYLYVLEKENLNNFLTK